MKSVTVAYFDERGAKIADKTVPSNRQWIAYLSPSDRKIKGIQVTGVGALDIYVDNFTLADEAPPLVVDQTQLVLSGANLSIKGSGLDWPLSGIDPAGTFADRTPSSGVPPYSYRSSNPDIASVDAEGRVRSEGNGVTTITVTDQLDQTAVYEVIAPT